MSAVEKTSALGSDDESRPMVLPATPAHLFTQSLLRPRRLAAVGAVLSLVAVIVLFLFSTRLAAARLPQGRAAEAISESGAVQRKVAPTMYCVSSVLLDTYEHSIFKSLLYQGRKHRVGLGIFGCDGFDVFSAKRVVLGRHYKKGPVHTVRYTQVPVGTSMAGNAANAELFVNMWSEVQRRGRSPLFDWTVKVDPDTVMFAQRLRSQLYEHTMVAEQRPMFLTNCVGGARYSVSSTASKRQLRESADAEAVTQKAAHRYFSSKSHLYGALEAFSREAMRVYFREGGSCQGSQIHKMGEDEYMGMCLSKFGVAVPDLDLIADAVCSPCTCERYAAAYHPYKTLTQWWACYHRAFKLAKPSASE